MIIEFEMPKDSDAFKMASHGDDLYFTLWDLNQWLKDQLKHNDKLGEEGSEKLQDAQDKLHEILGERGLSLDMVS